MKKYHLIILLLTISLLSCTNNQSEKNGHNETAPEALIVNQIMETPNKFIENKITVKGMVTHVCRHGGKRLHLSTLGSDIKLRVRTGGNISPFERSLEGSTVQVSGKLTEERFDESYIENLKKGEAARENQESSEHDNASTSERGVSQAYINELEQRIKNSDKGYISEYWLTAEKVTKK